jgi:hypothetical protein
MPQGQPPKLQKKTKKKQQTNKQTKKKTRRKLRNITGDGIGGFVTDAIRTDDTFPTFSFKRNFRFPPLEEFLEINV